MDSDVDALVNTVNTVGVMGKGIALQFKRAYPKMFKAYSQAVKRGEVKLGCMHVWPTEQFSGPHYIINFPTKAHWRSMFRLPDIERGLDDLVTGITDLQSTSIAVPPLGCGAGGLNWRDVQPLIHRKLESLSNVGVALFEPSGAPAAADMPTCHPAPTASPHSATTSPATARPSPWRPGTVAAMVRPAVSTMPDP